MYAVVLYNNGLLICSLTFSEDRALPVFVAIPAVVTFKNYKVGQVYEVQIYCITHYVKYISFIIMVTEIGSFVLPW